MAETKKALRVPEVTTQSATPASGKRLLYPKSDGWYEKNSAGVETKVGPNAASVANPMTTDTAQTVSGVKTFNTGALLAADANLVTEYAATQPATPASGGTLFTRYRGRRLPAFVGPTGQDTRLQPAMFSNTIARMQSVNASTVPTVDGMAVTWLNAGTATPTAVTTATTTFYTGLTRTRVATTTTAGTAGELRTNTPQWFLSSTANAGGFFFVCRFGLNTTAAGTRGFVGLSSQTSAYLATTDPSNQLNQIGFYWNAASTNMLFIASGSTVGVGVNLGTNYPISTGAGVYFYEAIIFSPSGSGQTVYYSLTRINDGLVVNGGPVTGTTTMPALGTLLNAHVYYGNGNLAAAHSMDIQNLYIETDN